MQVEVIGAGGTHGQEATAPSPRLVRAAHEFEAQMMNELLKPMTGEDSLTGDDESQDSGLVSGSGSDGTLADFASEALGQALSNRGGFGIADKIIRELTPAAGPKVTPEVGSKVTASPRANTMTRDMEKLK